MSQVDRIRVIIVHEDPTLSETISAQPTAAFYAKYGTSVIDPAFFTQLV